jgi:methylmalonyl-CoA mutase cobalamin-binding subunit
MPKRIRVLIARLGMDAHWRGSIMVARALRDAGIGEIFGPGTPIEKIISFIAASS